MELTTLSTALEEFLLGDASEVFTEHRVIRRRKFGSGASSTR